jgi:putative FmdB family regulatory protein
MPTYEYECRACGHAFETMHSMSAPVLRKCPKCGKLKLDRLISGGAGVIFKGSGFYETDYKRTRRGGGSDESSRAGDKSAGGDSSAPSESKPSEGKPKKPESKDSAKKKD